MTAIRDTSAVAVPDLAALDLFVGVDRARLDAVARRSTVIDAESGCHILREGAEAEELVVIVDGYAEVSIAGVTISYVGTGSCVGEMSLIDGRRRTATVTASSPVRAISVTRDDFAMLLRHEGSFRTRILTMLVGRLRFADAQLAERSGSAAAAPVPSASVADATDDRALRWMARSLAWERSLAGLRRDAGRTGPVDATGTPFGSEGRVDGPTQPPARTEPPRRHRERPRRTGVPTSP